MGDLGSYRVQRGGKQKSLVSNAALGVGWGDVCSQWSPLPPSSGQEHHKDDEEDDQNEEDLHHQPAVGGDGLEVFQDFRVGGVNVQLGIFHVGINSAGEAKKGTDEGQRGLPILI